MVGGLGLTADALSAAADRVERLLDRAEWLLDPDGKDAKGAVEGARGDLKLFCDAAQAATPRSVLKASGGGLLNGLVVDGFNSDQIWEELEVLNLPLRHLLQKRVKRLAAAPKGGIELSAAEDEPQRTAKGSTARAEAADGEEEEAAPKRKVKAKAKASKAAPAEDPDEDDEEIGARGFLSDKGKKGRAAKAGKAPAKGEKLDLFDEDAMHRFADLGDLGKLRVDADAGDSDFDVLEVGDDDDEDGGDMMFNDFFADADEPMAAALGEEGSSVLQMGTSGKKSKGKKSKAESEMSDEEAELAAALDAECEEDDDEGDAEGEEEEEEGLVGGEDEKEEMSDEERELEKQIQKLQQEGAGEEDDGDDDDDGDATGAEDGEAPSRQPKSLYEMDKRLSNLEAEVAKLEEEQMQERPWQMKGEVTGKQRPLNSLLEVHLDQPMSAFAGRRAEAEAQAAGGQDDAEDEALEDTQGAMELAKSARFDIDVIIKQRVWDETFDDVVRKEELPPSQRPLGADDDAVETLNFEKSRIGLGDVYAKQYETEFLGHSTDEAKKEDKEKTEAKQLFAKLMFKLDQLTNSHFTPRPPMAGYSAEQMAKVPSLKMEETIPLMVSDAHLKAPEELRAPRRHAKEQEELSHDERKAKRRNRKDQRRKALGRKVNEGKMTLADMRQREKKLAEANAAAKKDKDGKGKPKEQKTRIKSTELLAAAAAQATTDVSRKDQMRIARQKEAAGSASSSKKLKL